MGGNDNIVSAIARYLYPFPLHPFTLSLSLSLSFHFCFSYHFLFSHYVHPPADTILSKG